MYHAKLSTDTLKQAMPDYAERLFYISGPHGMVTATEQLLRQLGVPRSHIKKDFFSGYA
jgi:ferredoxin-NADP reductase